MGVPGAGEGIGGYGRGDVGGSRVIRFPTTG